MEVHVHLDGNNQVQVTLQGQAQGAATFRDLDTFVRFIEGCQRLLSGRVQPGDNVTPIPEAFLNAFKDVDSS